MDLYEERERGERKRSRRELIVIQLQADVSVCVDPLRGRCCNEKEFTDVVETPREQYKGKVVRREIREREIRERKRERELAVQGIFTIGRQAQAAVYFP